MAAPDISPVIRSYLELKSEYRNYDTKESLFRMQLLRKATQALQDAGHLVSFDILGSLNFGIVEPDSDCDIVIYQRCPIHKGADCGPDCPQKERVEAEIARITEASIRPVRFNVEVLDVINVNELIRLMSLMRTGPGGNFELARIDDAGRQFLFGFLFYRLLGRPVNRILVYELWRTLMRDDGLRHAFYDWSHTILDGYLATPGHHYSFRKYNERIKNSGFSLPEALSSRLSGYLSDTPLQKD